MIPASVFQTLMLSGQGRQPADACALSRARNYIHYDGRVINRRPAEAGLLYPWCFGHASSKLHLNSKPQAVSLAHRKPMRVGGVPERYSKVYTGRLQTYTHRPSTRPFQPGLLSYPLLSPKFQFLTVSRLSRRYYRQQVHRLGRTQKYPTTGRNLKWGIDDQAVCLGLPKCACLLTSGCVATPRSRRRARYTPSSSPQVPMSSHHTQSI